MIETEIAIIAEFLQVTLDEPLQSDGPHDEWINVAYILKDRLNDQGYGIFKLPS